VVVFRATTITRDNFSTNEYALYYIVKSSINAFTFIGMNTYFINNFHN